jgi:hypothetical protein
MATLRSKPQFWKSAGHAFQICEVHSPAGSWPRGGDERLPIVHSRCDLSSTQGVTDGTTLLFLLLLLSVLLFFTLPYYGELKLHIGLSGVPGTFYLCPAVGSMF